MRVTTRKGLFGEEHILVDPHRICKKRYTGERKRLALAGYFVFRSEKGHRKVVIVHAKDLRINA